MMVWLVVLLALGNFVLSAGCSDSGDDEEETTDVISDETGIKEGGVFLPPLSIDPLNPAPNGTVTVVADFPGADSIALAFDGAGCGSLSPNSGANPLSVSGNAADAGYCRVKATVDGALQEASFTVLAAEPPVPPVDVPNGMFIFGPKPPASAAAGRPTVQSIDGPASFINGSSSTYTVSYQGERSVTHAIIEIGGWEGYFLTPVVSKPGSVDISLAFDPDIYDKLPQARSTPVLQIFVSLIDAATVLGDAFNLVLNGVEVQTGDVKVSLSWDTASDVDLHVVTPDGWEIYYGNTTDSNGGQLDLDSNASCTIDNINNENIFWPAGQSPQGEYEVSAEMYADCETGGASGTVTITSCGSDNPIVHEFSLGATGDLEAWTFNSACSFQVSGSVKYEDFSVAKDGLSAAGAMVPVRFIKVQVLRDSDKKVLGEGSTNVSGEYKIDFQNDGEPGYFVQVVASQDNDRIKQKVTDLAGKLYAWKTDEVFDEKEEPVNEGVDFELKKADKAGALNIWETGAKCSTYARVYSGSPPPLVTFLWTEGQKPLGKEYSFATRSNKIYILSMASDPDEYDDFVIGHEHGHFTAFNYSRDNNPAGTHGIDGYYAPTLAWSEAWASFFGVTAVGGSTYIDTNAGGIGYMFDLENLPADVPLGTKDDKMEENCSEGRVAGVLYDLFDDTNEAKDTLSGLGVWRVVTGYLKKNGAKFKDRGVVGADFVDFLDGWFCMGLGEKGEDDSTGVRGIVKGLHGFNYDYAELASCE